MVVILDDDIISCRGLFGKEVLTGAVEAQKRCQVDGDFCPRFARRSDGAAEEVSRVVRVPKKTGRARCRVVREEHQRAWMTDAGLLRGLVREELLTEKNTVTERKGLS